MAVYVGFFLGIAVADRQLMGFEDGASTSGYSWVFVWGFAL